MAVKFKKSSKEYILLAEKTKHGKFLAQFLAWVDLIDRYRDGNKKPSGDDLKKLEAMFDELGDELLKNIKDVTEGEPTAYGAPAVLLGMVLMYLAAVIVWLSLPGLAPELYAELMQLKRDLEDLAEKLRRALEGG